MRKLAVPLALMLAVGIMVPTGGWTKELARDNALVDLKNAKRANEGKIEGRTDDKGGGTKVDDKGGKDRDDSLATDDKMKTCYVFVSGGKMTRPNQKHLSSADRMRIRADEYLRKMAGMIYHDDAVRYPEKAEDPKSYNPRYNRYLRDDRLGRKACVIL